MQRSGTPRPGVALGRDSASAAAATLTCRPGVATNRLLWMPVLTSCASVSSCSAAPPSDPRQRQFEEHECRPPLGVRDSHRRVDRLASGRRPQPVDRFSSTLCPASIALLTCRAEWLHRPGNIRQGEPWRVDLDDDRSRLADHGLNHRDVGGHVWLLRGTDMASARDGNQPAKGAREGQNSICLA